MVFRMQQTFTPQDKGDPVEMIGGVYKNNHGFIWKTANKCSKKVWIIVTLKDGTERGACLARTSFRVISNDRPATRIEAALRQHPTIDLEIDQVCKKLAQCSFDGTERELYNMFKKKMDVAVAQFNEEGPVRTYYHVDFDDGTANMEG